MTVVRFAETVEKSNNSEQEDFLAELTRIAYETALCQGIQGSFAELYLNLWYRLRHVLITELNKN